MLPSIPPGVAPLLGPQYIMSQGTLPLYQPAFTLNYDDIQYLQRGMHPPMVSGNGFRGREIRLVFIFCERNSWRERESKF